MKAKLTVSLLSFASLVVLNFNRLQAQTPGSIEMGPQYANEVFYSLTNGEVKVSPRNLWDIAFFTNAFSAGIITNDGAGVELYTYPNAAADGWESFDTTGMTGWTKMYNDPAEWENGAFNRNQKGHPDYGWGVYSSTTHDVVGDSLFLVKTPDGIFRKLNIVRKYSSLNRYEIMYALIDGTQEQSVSLEINPQNDRMFLAYSFANGIVDREPAAASWDILFTKYYATVQNTPYPVVGVLTNSADSAARVDHTDPEFIDWSMLGFNNGDDIIGYDWKYFDMSSFQYLMVDSLMYFVKDQDGDVHKIVFDSFSGSSTGIATFTVTLLSTLGVSRPDFTSVSVYPNPATRQITIEHQDGNQKGIVSLYDLNGRLLKEQAFESSGKTQLNVEGLANGTYVLKAISNGSVSTLKVSVFK
ncbi:MAG: T9SS type A sorting domain-containing protein [Bacteroidota bacterium]